MSKLLIDHLRALGLPCRGRMGGLVITWTTDEAKADAAREAGATVATVTNAGRLLGYEVSFPADAVLATAKEAA
jgi:hypothetical protein